MQKEEYLIKNACYSVTKYYLCKQNNKRSLLGRKQRSQVARSFPNRYQFSCTNKVTSLFSISCILRIIFIGNCGPFASPFEPFRPHFQPLIRVIKIQVVDCQRFKSTAKIRSFATNRSPVANIASREAENEQIV